MLRRPAHPRPAADPCKRIAFLWPLTGLIGLTVAIALITTNPLPDLSAAATSLLAVAGGWVAMLIFAPWRSMAAQSRKRTITQELARSLRRINAGQRDRPFQDIVLDCDDELGELSRAIHDTLTQANVDRRESRILQRNMNDTIRRETGRATHRLKHEATTDPLTGLGNRRELERNLAEYFGEQRRRSHDTVVAMVIDVDLFKAINDTLGHEVGDQCLAFLGQILRSALRTEDTPIRLGGDEFIVLMPNQTIDEAKAADM